MIKNKVYILLSLTLLIASCKPLGDLTRTDDAYCTGAKNPDGTCRNSANKSAKMSTVSLQNNQIILTGENLTGVTSVKITGPSGFNEALSINSKASDKLIASGLRAISFTVGAVFSLIIEDANGATTYPITFTLQDGSVTASKLSSMGAGVGQILKFNGTNWAPGDLGGLTYAGNWNANANNPDLTGVGTSGEYYIVATAGATDLNGGFGTDSWFVGDWVVWNDVLNQWEKIDNATNVTSFNRRNGAVSPQSNDYTWAQINKTTSSINDITDVDTTGATSGKVLKFDGTKWAIGDDNSGGVTSNSVSSSSITDGSIVNVDISSSAAIAQSKISNLTTDLAAKLSLSGGTMTGNLTMGNNNIITSGTVDGVDVSTLNTSVSGNTTAISGKEPAITAGTTSQYFRGDKSWQTLDESAVGLGNVNNTSDANKPISTATQTALNNKVDKVSSTTDNAVPRFDGASGSMQNSGVFVDDSNNFIVSGKGVFGNESLNAGSARYNRSLNLIDTSAMVKVHRVHSSYGVGVEMMTSSSATGPLLSHWDIFTQKGSDKSLFFRERLTGGAGDAVKIESGTGYVGIGTMSPSHLLHVAGVARSTQANFATSSDRRVKENIRDVEGGLELIMRLRPVRYNYTKEYVGSNQDLKGLKIGFIAQEVDEVDSTMVKKTVETFGDQVIEDFNILSTGNMLPLLVAAVKKQQKIIASQEKNIEALKFENKLIKEYLCNKDSESLFCVTKDANP